jgi:hypothetical protein
MGYDKPYYCSRKFRGTCPAISTGKHEPQVALLSDVLHSFAYRTGVKGHSETSGFVIVFSECGSSMCKLP